MKRFFIATAVLACGATACNSGSSSSAASNNDTSSTAIATTKTDMTEKNKQTAIAFVEGINNHDDAQAFKDASPDIIDYGNGDSPPIKGLDSCKQNLKMFMTAFPDVKGENFMTIGDGNQVAVFGDWSGTFKKALMGMKSTGKSFKVKDVDLFTFNDEGKITEHHSVQATQTYMMQIGAKMK